MLFTKLVQSSVWKFDGVALSVTKLGRTGSSCMHEWRNIAELATSFSPVKSLHKLQIEYFPWAS